MEKLIHVDAPKPDPIIKINKEYVPQPPKVVKTVKEVMGPTPPAEVITVPKYIEKQPEIVEKLIYVQKPQVAPQVIEKTVQEFLPQETVYEEVIKHVEAPKPPPIYQEVVHEVQAKPTYVDEMGVVREARSTLVRPDGPVIDT